MTMAVCPWAFCVRTAMPVKAPPGAVTASGIELPPPDSTLHRNKQPVKLWMVHLGEVDTPADIKPIEWFLITTLPVKNDADALQCVRWYRARWRIEEWHRVLKSGCNIEKVKNRTAGKYQTSYRRGLGRRMTHHLNEPAGASVRGTVRRAYLHATGA
ncbi:MAG: hypothetical protein EA353_04335 [Puniceicoccaceae bacterium]|nr:MAG: hypothetical protein EA353_04335 [Puniceicoccaceae bacterium]